MCICKLPRLTDQMFESGTLIASLIWGSIGVGFLVYGKKQKEWTLAFGGLALIAVSYFVASPLFMSLLSIGIIVAIFWLVRRF